jgi:hypothetical protein
MNKKLLNVVLTILSFGIIQTSNALTLNSTAVDIHDLFPVSAQGENGINLFAFSEATGNYDNLKNIGLSAWSFGGSSNPSLAPSIDSQGALNVINFGLPLVSPFGSGFDAIMGVNVIGAFKTLHIDQTVLSEGGNSAYQVDFSIYEGAANYSSPLWSATLGRGVPVSSNIDLPLISGGDYFFRVHEGVFNDIGSQSWQISMSGVTPVPEPETYAMMMAGLGLMGVVARRRKCKVA